MVKKTWMSSPKRWPLSDAVKRLEDDLRLMFSTKGNLYIVSDDMATVLPFGEMAAMQTDMVVDVITKPCTNWTLNPFIE